MEHGNHSLRVSYANHRLLVDTEMFYSADKVCKHKEMENHVFITI